MAPRKLKKGDKVDYTGPANNFPKGTGVVATVYDLNGKTHVRVVFPGIEFGWWAPPSHWTRTRSHS